MRISLRYPGERLLCAISHIITNGLQSNNVKYSASLFLTVEKEQKKCPGITYSAQGYSAELGPIFSEAHTSLSLEKLLDVEENEFQSRNGTDRIVRLRNLWKSVQTF